MFSKTKLGTTDLIVSQLCYGTNMLGTAIDQGHADSILDRFAELGGNFIDTARMYGDWVPSAPTGASERAVGAWLKGRNRSDFVIATKGGAVDMRGGDYRNRVTPADIAKDLAESLDHLGLDTIDLYWLHADNPEAAVEPIVDALVGHQQAGRVRYFGASNWSSNRIRAANAYAKSIGSEGFSAAQPFWGLAAPDTDAANAQGYMLYYERQERPIGADGMPIIPYAAQSGGYFTKLAERGESAIPDNLKARYADPVNKARFAAASALAEEKGVTINEVVLAYLINQPHQTIPIFGGRNPEQIEESVKAVSLRLTPQDLQQLHGG